MPELSDSQGEKIKEYKKQEISLSWVLYLSGQEEIAKSCTMEVQIGC